MCHLTGTNVTDLDKQTLVKILLFGNTLLIQIKEYFSVLLPTSNKRILLSTITYIK